MESGYLSNSALSASSSWDANHTPELSRLNKIPPKGKSGAWCARSNNGNQWLQVYFGRETTVTKVTTQGRYGCCNQWVMSYSLSYSVDGIHWAWYRLSDGQLKVIFMLLLFYAVVDVAAAAFSLLLVLFFFLLLLIILLLWLLSLILLLLLL